MAYTKSALGVENKILAHRQAIFKGQRAQRKETRRVGPVPRGYHNFHEIEGDTWPCRLHLRAGYRGIS